MDAATPWKYLAEHKDLRVVILVSEHPGAQFERKVSELMLVSLTLAERRKRRPARRKDNAPTLL